MAKDTPGFPPELDTNFTELVQLHERSWGMEQYPGRPSLADLLRKPVIVMWLIETPKPASSLPMPLKSRLSTDATSVSVPGRFVLTTHEHVDEINDLVLSMVMAGKSVVGVNRRIARVFVNQRPVKINGLRLMLTD